MTKDIINEIRTGEWIVVDVRRLVGSTFYSSIMEFSGKGRTHVEDCEFVQCEFVGNWKLPDHVRQSDLCAEHTCHEPEVRARMERKPRRRWRFW